MANNVLEIKDLSIHYEMREGVVKALNGVDLALKEGASHGLVGETGAGKTTLAKGVMGLMPKPYGKIKSGQVLYDGQDLLQLNKQEMRRIRGQHISMIFQEPMTSLNPLQTIGRQIAEAVLLHSDVTKQQAWEKAVEMLGMVGIASPEKRAKAYPHMLSGGMRQRVMIAMALSMNPHLLIADEPTTALDVTVQAQILELIKKLRDEIGMAIMLITHDLGVISETCERVIVMYAGEIVEQAPIRELFSHPSHPYTQGLIASVPRMKQTEKLLHTIPGMVPGVQDMPEGCRFAPRCSRAQERCMKEKPPTFAVNDGHYAACWLCAGRE